MGKPSGISWDRPVNLLGLFQAGADRVLPPFAMHPHKGGVINLGAGNKEIKEAQALDLPNWNADFDDIPYAEGTISEIYAFHVLEHVGDAIGLLRDCQRVLMPGGVLNIVVPYYRSQGAFHDLDHRHFFGEDTWSNLFDNEFYAKHHAGWKFDIGLNIIMGLNERNLMLVTQLIRQADE